MRKEQCPWGYKFNKRGTSRTVNRKHRCNVSCWERWTLMRCLQWARETAIRWGPGTGDYHISTVSPRSFATPRHKVGMRPTA